MDAEQVVVMSVVAQLVMEITVFQQYSTQDPGINQDLQGAIHGGPAEFRWQQLTEPFRSEMVLLFAYGQGKRPAWRSGAESPLLKGVEDSFGH